MSIGMCFNDDMTWLLPQERQIDRETALSILKELSRDMYPSYDLFGNKTLVIDRDKFERIRKKYLDEKSNNV